MHTKGERAFELLQRLSFERLGGSAEEKRAADILLAELGEFGVTGWVEEFPVHTYEIRQAKLEVLEPYQREYEVSGYGLTGSTTEEGLVADLLYVEDAGEISLEQAKGKIVLVNEGMALDRYEKLSKAGAIGFISMGGQVYERQDLPKRSIREPYFKHGKIPGLSMFASDALELVRLKASKVRLVLHQEEMQSNSRNVIAEIKGTKHPEEVIVLGAHFDSVPYSSGANDNGAGSVILMELARYFQANPPARTLRFCWFGSEEYGLLGSFAYVEAHKDDLANIKFMVNVDVAGGVLGRNVTFVMGSDALKGYVEVLAREYGLEMMLRHDVYSSDSVPFCEQGIPSINFTRFGAPIHNRHDVIDFISEERLAELGDFALLFTSRMANAVVFPIRKEIPETVKKSLQKYLEARRGKADPK